MNKTEFLAELRRRLKNIPKDDAESAVGYYEEYLSDAEDEQAAIAELGTPARIASQIIGEYAIKDIDKKENSKKGKSTFWIVMLAIFASPIALPIALAVAVLVIALLIVVLAVLFSLMASGLAVAFSGLISAICGVVVAPTGGLPTMLFFCGAGMAALGLGTLLTIAAIWLAKVFVKGMVKLMSKFLLRRTAA